MLILKIESAQFVPKRKQIVMHMHMSMSFILGQLVAAICLGLFYLKDLSGVNCILLLRKKRNVPSLTNGIKGFCSKNPAFNLYPISWLICLYF